MPNPVRIYILETDETVRLILAARLDDASRDKPFRLIGFDAALPPDGCRFPDADAVVYDPRASHADEVVKKVLAVWAVFPNKVEVILHADEWSIQDVRNQYKDYGVSKGIVREDWKRLFVLLEKMAAAP